MDKKKINNPVAKHAPEFCKPKTFRNRKKDYTRKQKYEDKELEHPVHKPYKREHLKLEEEASEALQEMWDEEDDEYLAERYRQCHD